MSGHRDEPRRKPFSRRRFIEGAGAALGAAALVEACGGDGGAGQGTAASGGVGVAGLGGTGGTGSPGGTGGSGGTTATGGTGGTLAGTGGTSGTAAGTGGTTAGTTGGPGMDAGSGLVRVAFVKDAGDLDATVARAIELAGGLEAIGPSDTVFIKPNAVSDRAIGTPGIRTSTEVLASVIRLVKARNPAHIVVGDRSARGFDSQQVFDASGLGAAALAAGADEVYAAPSPALDPDAWMLLQPTAWEESWMGQGGILGMRRILEANHLINVPQLKDHRYALFSLSLKNFIGGIGDSSRDVIHYLSSGTGNFEPIGRDIAILNQIFSPLVNVIDGTTALINGGPQGDGSDAVRTTPGLVLASRDRVALDAAAVAFLTLEQSRTTIPSPDAAQAVLRDTPLWSLPQIANAAQLGVGVQGADDAELVFEGVADAAEIEARFRG